MPSPSEWGGWTAPDPLTAEAETLAVYLAEIRAAITWHANELEITIVSSYTASSGDVFRKNTLDVLKTDIERLADEYGYDGIDDPDLLGRDWTPYEYVELDHSTSRAKWDYQLIQDMRQILENLETQGFIETWDASGYSGYIPTSINYSDSVEGECVYAGPYPRSPGYWEQFRSWDSSGSEVAPFQGDYKWDSGSFHGIVKGSDYVHSAGDHEPRTNEGDVSITFNKGLDINLTMQGGTFGIDGRGHGGSRRHSYSEANMNKYEVVGAYNIALPKNIQFSISGLSVNATKEFSVIENGVGYPAMNGMGEVYMRIGFKVTVGGINILPLGPSGWYLIREVHHKEDGGYGIFIDINTSQPTTVNYTLPAAGKYTVRVEFFAEARADYGSGGFNAYGTWNIRYNLQASFDDIKIIGI